MDIVLCQLNNFIMPVYIDDAKLPFGNMVMCHMISDTTEELLQMCDKIGVQRKWIQDAGTYQEHFDVCLTKRAKAIAAGAVQIGKFETGRMLLRRAKTGKLLDPPVICKYCQQDMTLPGKKFSPDMFSSPYQDVCNQCYNEHYHE